GALLRAGPEISGAPTAHPLRGRVPAPAANRSRLHLGQSAILLKDTMMRSRKPAALLVGLAAFVVTCGAQVRAQEFRIQDVTAPAGLAVDGLKPRTIAFLDRPGDELLDPDTGLIRFEDWAQARPLEKQFLTPFPSYLEPYVETTVDGVPKRFKEKLHMYVAEARFALARPPGSIDLASFVSLPFVERIDAAIKHNLIAP